MRKVGASVGTSFTSSGPLRRLGLAAWDVLGWVVALAVALGVRHSFNLSPAQWSAVFGYLPSIAVFSVALGYLTKLYRGRFLVGSFDEALGVALHTTVVAVVGLVAWQVQFPWLPWSAALGSPLVALAWALAGRWAYRVFRDRAEAPETTSENARRVLVYGAGEAGGQVVRLLRKSSDPRMVAVGFVDDNLNKRHLKLQGVRVLGDGTQLEGIADSTRAEAVILAIPSASGRLVSRVQEQADELGLDFFVLPAPSDLVGGRVHTYDIRHADIADILGRHQVATDLGEIADYLTGRRVLVTGAGGSIGSELVRQVKRFNPASLVMLDRDESALHGVQLSVFGHGLLNTPDTVLVDIRDAAALRKVFEEHRPDIVFHAAALKHLPMLERFPDEGWKTNVLGSLNLLQLANEYGAERFVNVSTDKAADASSVLGRTKRIAEQLTAWMAEKSGRPYISVRFGNVLGSRGSVLYAFSAQIESGGPVTVTHPDVTRYFMTIPEACELVVQAGAIGKPGEVMVLEMGEPVRIVDVAERMISMSGKRGIEVVFTGLRPGEKLHEQLFGEDEASSPTSNELIRTVHVPPISPEEIDSLGTDSASSEA